MENNINFTGPGGQVNEVNITGLDQNQKVDDLLKLVGTQEARDENTGSTNTGTAQKTQ